MFHSQLVIVIQPLLFSCELILATNLKQPGWFLLSVFDQQFYYYFTKDDAACFSYEDKPTLPRDHPLFAFFVFQSCQQGLWDEYLFGKSFSQLKSYAKRGSHDSTFILLLLFTAASF